MHHVRHIAASTLALFALSGTLQGQVLNPGADWFGAIGGGGDINLLNVLTIVTDNAQQQIEIEVAPVQGEVRVFGVDGIPDGQVFVDVSAIDLTTGSAQDFVEFRIFANVAPDIAVNTRAGNSDLKVIYDISAGPDASSMVMHTGGSGEDKINFEVLAMQAASFEASWSAQHAGGASNEMTVAFTSDTRSDAITLDIFGSFGAGQDKLDVSVVHDTAALSLTVASRMGAGNDNVNITTDGLGVTALSSNLDVATAGGEDTATASYISRGGSSTLTGALNMGADLDSALLLLEGDGVINTRLLGGAGNDVLDIFAKGLVSGTPTFRAGDGNDFLKIVVDGPRIATPILDGGPGFDEAIGFGTFISVEKIN